LVCRADLRFSLRSAVRLILSAWYSAVLLDIALLCLVTIDYTYIAGESYNMYKLFFSISNFVTNFF